MLIIKTSWPTSWSPSDILLNIHAAMQPLMEDIDYTVNVRLVVDTGQRRRHIKIYTQITDAQLMLISLRLTGHLE